MAPAEAADFASLTTLASSDSWNRFVRAVGRAVTGVTLVTAGRALGRRFGGEA